MTLRITKRPSEGSNLPLLIALLFVGLAVSSIFYIGARQHSQNPAASNGERLYNQSCAACHGADGQGYIIPDAPPLNSTGTLWQKPDGEIQRIILTGGTLMPDHEAIFSTQDAADIIRYIQTWWTEEQLAGQQLLSQTDPMVP